MKIQNTPVRAPLIFCLALVLLIPVVAWSQAVTMVVSSPAGGSVDVAARRLASRATAALGEEWVVSNAPGALGGVARSMFDRSAASETVLILPDATVVASATQGLTQAATIVTQSFALVGRAGVLRPSIVAHAFGESTHARALAEKIAQAVQATAVPYKGAATAIFDAKQGQDAWVLIEGSGVPLAQREGLQVLAVGDKNLGLTDGEGQPLNNVTQSYPSFAELLGQPIPPARATISVYVQPTGGQVLAAKLLRIGTPVTLMARPLPDVAMPALRPGATDDPKARGRSARLM